MGLLNPTLRDPGPTPGSAAHWMFSSACAAQRIAAFGPSPERAAEDFERWAKLVTTFAEGTLVLALFDAAPKGYEAFDGWSDGAFLDALPAVLLDACSFGGAGVEPFDGWLSAPWTGAWGDVTPDTALFGGVGAEGFETWSAPVTPAWASARFAPAAATAEAFDGAWSALKTV